MTYKSPDNIIVIGGGIAGVAITRYLSKCLTNSLYKPSITLLEKSNRLCSGATWHAGK